MPVLKRPLGRPVVRALPYESAYCFEINFHFLPRQTLAHIRQTPRDVALCNGTEGNENLMLLTLLLHAGHILQLGVVSFAVVGECGVALLCYVIFLLSAPGVLIDPPSMLTLMYIGNGHFACSRGAPSGHQRSLRPRDNRW